MGTRRRPLGPPVILVILGRASEREATAQRTHPRDRLSSVNDSLDIKPVSIQPPIPHRDQDAPCRELESERASERERARARERERERAREREIHTHARTHTHIRFIFSSPYPLRSEYMYIHIYIIYIYTLYI
jgi:hypothetical protein